MEPTRAPSGATPRPVPTQHERPFGADEIFFSTTDRRGIIRSGNRVFARVSGYTREELVGSPHNLIRHSDMPRCVFKLLWDEIQADRPIVAYVKNMAKDGAYYWVLATVVPCDGGYLSVRIKPTTALFDAVQGIYAELLALEQDVEGGVPARRPQAMQAAQERLGELLGAAGFSSYGAFMRTALLAEVNQFIKARRAPEAVTRAVGLADRHTLDQTLFASESLDRFLGLLLGRIDVYTGLNRQLAEDTGTMQELAEDVQLFSLNAQLAACRVQEGGGALSAVSSLMQARTDESAPAFRALVDDAASSASLLDAMLLPVGIAKLQAQALLAFLSELSEGRADERATADDLGALAQCLANEVDQLTPTLVNLEASLRTLGKHVTAVQSAIRSMRALELNGRIEAAHVAEAGAVVALFRSIAERITRATTELDGLMRVGRFSLSSEIDKAHQSQEHVTSIRGLVSMLGNSKPVSRNARGLLLAS
ncbi:MAG: PAS domain S-box protein [Chloroflexota bacterium]